MCVYNRKSTCVFAIGGEERGVLGEERRVALRVVEPVRVEALEEAGQEEALEVALQRADRREVELERRRAHREQTGLGTRALGDQRHVAHLLPEARAQRGILGDRAQPPHPAASPRVRRLVRLLREKPHLATRVKPRFDVIFL